MLQKYVESVEIKYRTSQGKHLKMLKMPEK